MKVRKGCLCILRNKRLIFIQERRSRPLLPGDRITFCVCVGWWSNFIVTGIGSPFIFVLQGAYTPQPFLFYLRFGLIMIRIRFRLIRLFGCFPNPTQPIWKKSAVI